MLRLSAKNMARFAARHLADHGVVDRDLAEGAEHEAERDGEPKDPPRSAAQFGDVRNVILPIAAVLLRCRQQV
jgi:hypothetical protein